MLQLCQLPGRRDHDHVLGPYHLKHRRADLLVSPAKEESLTAGWCDNKAAGMLSAHTDQLLLSRIDEYRLFVKDHIDSQQREGLIQR